MDRELTGKPDKGYVYVVEEEKEHVLHNAVAGQTFANPERKPPFIVVDHHPESVIVARWPGKLWYVQILDAVTKEDIGKDRSWGLVAKAGYTRAFKVKVLEEIPVSRLFGEQGDAVVEVLDFARQMTIEHVGILKQHLPADGSRAYSDAWNAWSESIQPGNIHVGNNRQTLAMPGIKSGGSPINHGFMLLNSIIWKRARELEGDAAFYEETEDGETEIYLVDNWSQAQQALLYAAMALGASRFVNKDDSEILLQGWKNVIYP